MNWLANYGITKQVSHLPYGPVSCPERIFPKRFNNYKRIRLPPHLHEPIAQLSDVSIPLLKKGDIVGTYQVPSCAFDCVTMERPWENGMQKSTSTLEARIHEVQGKIDCQNGVLLRHLLLQFLVGNPPNRVKNTMSRTRGAQPPPWGRERTIGCIGLWGLLAWHIKPKT